MQSPQCRLNFINYFVGLLYHLLNEIVIKFNARALNIYYINSIGCVCMAYDTEVRTDQMRPVCEKSSYGFGINGISSLIVKLTQKKQGMGTLPHRWQNSVHQMFKLT